eukprot:jgi/Botrbrau1/6917/Bobra.67_3s0034.1
MPVFLHLVSSKSVSRVTYVLLGVVGRMYLLVCLQGWGKKDQPQFSESSLLSKSGIFSTRQSWISREISRNPTEATPEGLPVSARFTLPH